MVDDKFLKWLIRQFAHLTEKGRICRVDLMHTIEGEGADRCGRWDPEEGQDIEMLSQEIWECAEHDASTRSAGTRQRYVVLTFDRPDVLDPVASFPFVITSRGMPGYLGDNSDPPNEKGVTAQLIRQVENQHRIIMHSASAQAMELERERAARMKAEDRAMSMLEKEQELLDRHAERQIETAKNLMRAKRQDDMMAVLIGLAPLVAAKFLGGNEGIGKLAEAGAARSMAIGQILKNLSQEEAIGIMQSLKGTNKMAFLELYKSYAEEDEKTQAEKPEVLRDAAPAGGESEKH
jgi:hypothetical protein